MMDVAIAIDAESVDVMHVPVTAAGGSYIEGEWVPNAAVPVTIRAAIQPASGRQLMDLPEGVRTEAKFMIWSRVAIVENDGIIIDSKSWRVIFVWPRPMDGFTRGALGLMTP